jgi:translation elongation factor EF-1alpha
MMGHLLINLKEIDKSKIHQNEKLCREYGKESFAFAYVMD